MVLDELWNQGRIPYSEERSDKQKSIEIQPLSGHEAWMFARIAFKEGHAPMELEDSVAYECKGFPLALNAEAPAMKCKSCVDEWAISLSLMKPSDQSFPQIRAPVDQELYQRLKWSCDAFPIQTSKFASSFQLCLWETQI